jgi:Arc/MetJ-type ribon-helix-helix transcriptional regulator
LRTCLGVTDGIVCSRFVGQTKSVTRYIDLASLPEEVARYAQGQIDAGRFTRLEDVLAAGLEALQDRDEADQHWLIEARREAEVGFAELDRGEGTRATVTEHMARIDAAVRARTGK